MLLMKKIHGEGFIREKPTIYFLAIAETGLQQPKFG
jgi:hypothetical protein